MSFEDKKDFILFRLKEAEESIKESELLLNNKSYRASVNRFYYSMFYGILALINISGSSFSKHTGVISHFDKEFVKTGKFSKEYSKSLHTAFEIRQESDYLDMKEVSFEEAKNLFESAKKLLLEIKNYLRTNYGLFYTNFDKWR